MFLVKDTVLYGRPSSNSPVGLSPLIISHHSPVSYHWHHTCFQGSSSQHHLRHVPLCYESCVWTGKGKKNNIYTLNDNNQYILICIWIQRKVFAICSKSNKYFKIYHQKLQLLFLISCMCDDCCGEFWHQPWITVHEVILVLHKFWTVLYPFMSRKYLSIKNIYQWIHDYFQEVFMFIFKSKPYQCIRLCIPICWNLMSLYSNT